MFKEVFVVKRTFWIIGVLLAFVIAGFTFGSVINLTILGGGPADPRTKSEKQAKEVLDEIMNLPFNSEMKKHYEV